MDGTGHRDAGDVNPLDGLHVAGGGANAQASTQLYISLFLILIAFFMVLNALSNQEVARSGAVMESVQSTFRSRFPPVARGLDLLAGKEIDVHAAEFHESLTGLFTAMVEFPGSFGWPGGGLIRAELPTGAFFAGTAIRSDREKTLDDMAATLTRGHPGERRAIEILVAVPPALLKSAISQDDAARNGYLLRAAALARALEDRGVPGAAITTGVMADDRALLWLTFGSRPVERGAE